MEPLSEAQKKQESATPSVTQRNSPKQRRGEPQANEGSRKSHSSDSKHRNYQKEFDNVQLAEMCPDVTQQKHGFSLTQNQTLNQRKDDGFQPEAGEGPQKKENQRRHRSRNHQ